MNRCRVVLVRPEIAANIGSVARVMCNFGVDDLVLVDPVADPLSESAAQLATHHAHHLLQQARIVPDLCSALADCVLTAATSAITGGLFRRQNVSAPEQIAPHLVQAFASGPVALVFGPEPHGLSNDEVSRCHFLMHIPTEAKCPALNLAQAVAVCLYEVRRVWLQNTEKTSDSPVAAYEEQERMFRQLEKGLKEIRYLRGLRGEVLMHALRHLIGRARPSPMEVRLLQGLARQLSWIAERTSLEDDPDSPSNSL